MSMSDCPQCLMLSVPFRDAGLANNLRTLVRRAATNKPPPRARSGSVASNSGAKPRRRSLDIDTGAAPADPPQTLQAALAFGLTAPVLNGVVAPAAVEVGEEQFGWTDVAQVRRVHLSACALVGA